MNGNNLEIERKYLIRRPEEARLAAMPGAEIWDLVQTYLTDGADGSTRRVRSVRTDGKTHYTHTVKHRVTVLSCEEMEEEISRETGIPGEDIVPHCVIKRTSAFTKFPITRHSAPHGILLNCSRRIKAQSLLNIRQTYGRKSHYLISTTIERRSRIEKQSIHHILRRTTKHKIIL